MVFLRLIEEVGFVHCKHSSDMLAAPKILVLLEFVLGIVKFKRAGI